MLNAKKTKCVNFSLSKSFNTNCNIKLNDESLEFIESTVFLGITLDNRTQWGAQIQSLASKLSSAAFAVRKVRQYTDTDTARLVYFSYFHSLLSYGILLWGKAADIKNIFILQKRAVRAIYCMKSRDSLREKFKEANILTVASQFIYSNILYVHKNLDLFPKNSNIHNINTRFKDKLAVPKYRLEKVNRSFMGIGIKIYNKIPKDMLELPLNKFKTSVKSYLLSKAYYSLNDYLNDECAWQ